MHNEKRTYEIENRRNVRKRKKSKIKQPQQQQRHLIIATTVVVWKELSETRDKSDENGPKDG